MTESHPFIKPVVGRYEICETVSIRDQATVFKAFDPDLQRFVSLKLYHDHAHRPIQKDVHSVIAEGRALARVESPYVARCHNVETVDNTPILVNEWVDGENLEEYLSTVQLTLSEIFKLFRNIVRGIAAIHDHGLLHRDIKPTNIIVSPHGHPKIIDLGLAQDCSESQPDLAGTFAFAAPEVANGERDLIGPRTDVFGLGAVLYFLLSGRAIYEAETKAELFAMARDCEITSTNELAGSTANKLDRICAKCLSHA